MLKLVNNVAKSTTLQIKIVNLAGDFEQTFKHKWCYVNEDNNEKQEERFVILLEHYKK